MAEARIKVRDNGPYLVTGPVELVDVDGNRFAVGDNFALCRCGQSKNKPFCDGAHKAFFASAPRAK